MRGTDKFYWKVFTKETTFDRENETELAFGSFHPSSTHTPQNINMLFIKCPSSISKG